MPSSSYLQPADRFEYTSRLVESGVDSLNNLVGDQPAPTGEASRQTQIPSGRLAKNKRHLIKWLAPEQPLISMYINPQSLNITDGKIVSQQQTKAGFLLQYWGEHLTKIQLSGHTGTSGIEGINVLEDVYRNEQLMFDPFALYLESQRQILKNEEFDDLLFGPNTFGAIENVAQSLKAAQRGTMFVNKRVKPTLANLAFGVKMFYNGVVYSGYFESFSVRESVDTLGMFNYDISFVAYEKRGIRTNSFAWQKSPVAGPAEAPPDQKPYSYNNYYNPQYNNNLNSTTSFVETTEQTTRNKNLLNASLAKSAVDPFNVF